MIYDSIRHRILTRLSPPCDAFPKPNIGYILMKLKSFEELNHLNEMVLLDGLRSDFF
jgi:hypothetical protein